jgi:hypothetical protein
MKAAIWLLFALCLVGYCATMFGMETAHSWIFLIFVSLVHIACNWIGALAFLALFVLYVLPDNPSGLKQNANAADGEPKTQPSFFISIPDPSFLVVF